MNHGTGIAPIFLGLFLVRRLSGLLAILLGLAVSLSSAPLVYGDFIPPGTQVRVRLTGPLVISVGEQGQVYTARLDIDVFDQNGNVAISRGALCHLIARQGGPDQIALDLQSIDTGQQQYVVDAGGPLFNMSQAQSQSLPEGTALTFQLRSGLQAP